jgi:transcriptional regulator with XRE-family HTH domain
MQYTNGCFFDFVYTLTHTNHMDIATIIDTAMRAKGINQPELSALSGVPQATISRTLKGQTTPATATLMKLCAALGIPLSGIGVADTPDYAEPPVTGEPQPQSYQHSRRAIGIAPPSVTLDLDADCLVVWSQLNELPPRDREEWRAKLDIAAATARLAKLPPRDQVKPDENPLDVPKDARAA